MFATIENAPSDTLLRENIEIAWLSLVSELGVVFLISFCQIPGKPVNTNAIVGNTIKSTSHTWIIVYFKIIRILVGYVLK